MSRGRNVKTSWTPSETGTENSSGCLIPELSINVVPCPKKDPAILRSEANFAGFEAAIETIKDHFGILRLSAFFWAHLWENCVSVFCGTPCSALSLAERDTLNQSLPRDWLELLDFKEEQSSFFEDYSHGPLKDSERKIKHNKSMAIWTDKNAQCSRLHLFHLQLKEPEDCSLMPKFASSVSCFRSKMKREYNNFHSFLQ